MAERELDEDDSDKAFIYRLTLRCEACDKLFRKEHGFICPACGSRQVRKPTTDEFDCFYDAEENKS